MFHPYGVQLYARATSAANASEACTVPPPHRTAYVYRAAGPDCALWLPAGFAQNLQICTTHGGIFKVYDTQSCFGQIRDGCANYGQNPVGPRGESKVGDSPAPLGDRDVPTWPGAPLREL
eukprot:COSAG02_NODE_2358_length_9064_cov_12.658003_2_plen_120_part_00